MIDVSKISKSYGQHRVLDRLNLQVQAGEIVALVGPNGVGKTTLLKIICHLEKADKGTVSVAGVSHTDQAVFKQVAIMLEASALYGYLTGYDHLAYVAAQHGLGKAAIEEVVDDLKIGHYINKRVSGYSLGMTQKLLFAMAVLPKTPFLILDEPHIGLDPTNIIQQRDYLKKLSQSGTGILLSSHHLAEIEHLTDKVFFLKNGQLLQQAFAVPPGTAYLVTLTPSSETDDWLAKHPQTLLHRGDKLTIGLTEQGLLEVIGQVPASAITDISRASDYLETYYRQLYLEEVSHEPEI